MASAYGFTPRHGEPDSVEATPAAAVEPSEAPEPAPVSRPGSEPGEALSKSAIDKRLRRVFTPRADGTYSVSDDFVKKYMARGEERDKLLVMFEKCNYNPDWAWQTGKHMSVSLTPWLKKGFQ